MKTHSLVATLVALPMLIGGAKATTITFGNPGDTAGATVDRYAPAVFQSGVSFAGHSGTLQESTSVGGSQQSYFCLQQCLLQYARHGVYGRPKHE